MKPPVQTFARVHFFRLNPFLDTENDKRRFASADYARDDKVELDVVNWIQESKSRILFLTGVSGAGKSSLTNAYVIPALRAQQYEIVSIRSFDDPITQTTESLKSRKSIWTCSPSDDLSLIDLVDAAAEAIAPRRLLLVFDQFEELLIIPSASTAKAQAFSLFLDAFNKSSSNALCILILRSDYIAQLRSFNYPSLEQYSNWIDIAPFSTHSAQGYLERSGLELTPTALEMVLTQAAELEETPGLIRPITINMFGLAIERLGQDRLFRAKKQIGGILTRYLRAAISAPLINGYSRRVLKPMLSEAGTKRPISVDQLSIESRLPNEVVLNCLIQLEIAGIVRRLERADRYWEVAHDFVARLLHFVLNNWRRTAIERALSAAGPVALTLWVLMFAILWPRIEGWQAQRTIQATAATFQSLDAYVAEHPELRHVYVPPASYPEMKEWVSEIMKSADGPRRAVFRMDERGFAVRLFSFYETEFRQHNRAIASRNTQEMEHLDGALYYFNQCLLRNPRLLYFWRADGGHLESILSVDTNKYYEQNVLHNPSSPLEEEPDFEAPVK